MNGYIKKYLWEYLKEVFVKWYSLLGIVPGIYGVVTYYNPTYQIKYFPFWIGFVFVIIFFVIANFHAWVAIKKKLDYFESKKPKLDLSFENETKEMLIESKMTDKKYSENKENTNNLKLIPGVTSIVSKLISNTYFKPLLGAFSALQGGSSFLNKLKDEIEAEYIPVKIILENNGDFPANNVNIHLDFPENVDIIEKYPDVGGIITILPRFKHNPTKGTIVGKKSVQLWLNKSQHPFNDDFPLFYLSVKEEGDFKINYTINADELGANEVKGELIIKSKPRFSEELFSNKDEMDKEVEEKDKLIRQCKPIEVGYE